MVRRRGSKVSQTLEEWSCRRGLAPLATSCYCRVPEKFRGTEDHARAAEARPEVPRDDRLPGILARVQELEALRDHLAEPLAAARLAVDWDACTVTVVAGGATQEMGQTSPRNGWSASPSLGYISTANGWRLEY